MPRPKKKPLPAPVLPPPRQPDLTNITNCTFINGEAGKAASDKTCEAVISLSEAIIALAEVLQGTQPGMPKDPAIKIMQGHDDRWKPPG